MRNIQGVANVKRRGKDTGRLKAEGFDALFDVCKTHSSSSGYFILSMRSLLLRKYCRIIFIYFFLLWGSSGSGPVFETTARFWVNTEWKEKKRRRWWRRRGSKQRKSHSLYHLL